MNDKIIKVFYDEMAYPFKDKERSVRYPIVGSAFMNASNTTEIRFYCKDIGGDNRTWIVIGKLPNGKRGFKFLGSSQTDSETGEKYFSFHLNQFFTQYKGDLYLSLGGYSGALEELQEYDTYELSANAIVETTGAIKLNVAYATPLSGSDTEIDTWQGFLGELGLKANKDQVIIKYTLESTLYSEYSNFDDYQAFYCIETNRLYMKYQDELVVLTRFDIGFITFTRLGITTSVTDEQLMEITKPHCLAYDIYSGRIYIKNRFLGNVCTFASPTISFDSTGSGDEQYTTLRQDGVFEVNTETKALTLLATSLTLYSKDQSNTRFAVKSGNNTFTGSNVFNTSPQTNDSDYGDGTGTKLTTKNYVISKVNEINTSIGNVGNRVTTIEVKIPSEASSTNKLADKDFVNSTINSLVAFYITKNAQGDPFANYSELASATTFYSGGVVRVPTRNDYCLVVADETHPIQANDYSTFNNTNDYVGYYVSYSGVLTLVTHDNKDTLGIVAGTTIAYITNASTCRYIYQGTQWEFQFVVNETPFTSDQIKAINSGITDTLVAQITTNANAITTINGKLPRTKDFVVPTTSWALVGGKYVAELDAGVDFVINDNAMHLFTPTSNNDQLLRDTYGINVSSDATTQKFTFTCNIGNEAPSEVINFTIAQFGGN